MDIYRRYFKVEKGPLIQAVENASKINAAAHEQYKSILADIGAELKYYHIDQRLTGIVFTETPDAAIYRRKSFGWYPKNNCTKGREIARKLEAVKTANPQHALQAVGLTACPTMFCNHRAYHSTLTYIPSKPPVIYVAVPWYDEDPAVLEQYKKEHATGTHSSVSYDALLWTPTPDMVEVKRWEAARHIDEWNEQVKAEKTPA